MKIRDATLEELSAVNQQIVEFVTPYPLEVLQDRLAGRFWIGLVAEDDDGALLGFKLGYEEVPQQFYSWLGGVIPAARGKGAARALLLEQESRLRAKRYHEVRVKSRNRYRAMLLLLLSEGYEIIGVEPQEAASDNRVWFRKALI